MRVIGHRGTPTDLRHTENTLPAVVAAFEAALPVLHAHFRAHDAALRDR